MRIARILMVLMAMIVAVAVGGSSDGMRDMLYSLSRKSDAELLRDAKADLKAGRRDMAEKEFFTVCSRYESTASEETQKIAAECFNGYGMLMNERGLYPIAMDYYLKARRIAEKYELRGILSEVYANLGNVYGWNNDYESARRFFLMALPMSGESTDARLRNMLLKNLVAVNSMMGRPDSARYYALAYERESKRDPRYEYDVMINRALIANAEQKMDSALHYAHRSARAAMANQKLPVLCLGASYSTLAEFFEKTGQLDSAAYYLKECQKISEKYGYHHLRVETLGDLGRVYDLMGRKQQAMEYKSQYLSLADSINFQENSDKLNASQTAYDLETSAEEIRDLNADKRAQRDWLLVLGAFLCLSGLFIVVLIRQKRKLKAAWTELYHRNRAQLEAEQSRRVVANDDMRRKIAADILRVMDETEEYCSPDFSIERLATLIGSNARYVSEVLNDEMGKNFRTLLNEYRVKKAMMRLEDREHYGNLTIKAIAESVGYKSQTTFITAFTKQTGLKPGIYQKLAQTRQESQG